MGYEAMGVWDYPEDTRALHLLLEHECAPRMDFVVNCMGYNRDENEKNWAPEKCTGEHCQNLNAALFLNDAKLEGDFKYIKSSWRKSLRRGQVRRTPRRYTFASCPAEDDIAASLYVASPTKSSREMATMLPKNPCTSLS